MLQTELVQDRYQLKEKLGENTGRQTWLAEDIQANQFVVIKLLAFNPQMWDELKLFEREAQVLKHLNHPRIPQYKDYFSWNEETENSLPWFGLVQDYIPGISLKQLLEEGKSFSEKDVYSYAIQILNILIYLHELSPPVIHRDIKPSNLVLGEDGKICLVDFGSVQDKAKAEGVTFTVVGTSGYAPPEQLWGKTVPASDLYALGATLIHLLTAIPPCDLPQRQMRLQFSDKVNINSSFVDWLEKLISPAPEQRFNSAREALEALQSSQIKTVDKFTVRYGRLALFTFAQLLAIFAALSMLSGGFNKVEDKQVEGRDAVMLMNYYQRAYEIKNKKFANSINKLNMSLSMDFHPQTINYSYVTVVKKDVVFSYALPRTDNLESYVGAVFSVPINTTKADKKTMNVSSLCETNYLSSQLPRQPILQNGQLVCAPGTHRSLGEGEYQD